ncbi:MAG TPA: alpha-L-arabinofuranosidase C-terminal domain-containing protein, partial [Lachnospiraceae bacterium]|nr:alpha-L-arabinofuranosidase C-terminal domain-containing protein [Lachnospiraceae bacterium]
CMTVTGTKSGTLSSAGPRIYVNGEIACDGLISQTSSGTYAKLRSWFATFNDTSNYCNNMIGASQYDADADFCGSLSDLRIYKASLTQDEIIEVMCESLSDNEMVTLAKDRYLTAPMKIVTKSIHLPTSLMGGKVSVVWESSNPAALSNEGIIGDLSKAQGVTLTATLLKGNEKETKSYKVSVLPKDIAPYELTIDASKELVNISDTLYGLFYEDINNAADGGIYAELIKNRSFEAFVFDTYDARSGENGASTGRNRTPLDSWFGDLNLITVLNQGGLNEFFQINDNEVNSYYITVKNGATLYNYGFCDTNHALSIYVRENEKYDFTVWAKSKEGGSITISLADEADSLVSDKQTIAIQVGDWKKYGVENKITLTGNRCGLSKFVMQFEGEISIDMVSLIPQNVWGASEETTSATAHSNYVGNPNYRLRRDLVDALVDLHPTFLRFPGGCISEGSYIWDNVYDWKDSIGAVELRKENFNVWGYMMTLGLGYMEYFQLAEDLNATPLPVMACGVLCQARSDYANPAGGSLQEKYIRNFTDLIDFAISTDTEGNEWAKLRKSMGHEAPFDLHYLGVGNENWGTEFFASFEIFKSRIDAFMKVNYPDYDLTIISTAGAQADDDAYQEGWKFLSGNLTGSAEVAFTDGETSETKTVTWYQEQPHYMETIVDEHYYRSNEYLLENVDRYNYYYRAYNIDGTIDESNSSKVFVGEYASSDKNTLAGAVAEAAVMTGFENNSDVVRLAATAPLFNKVLTDSTYRWTPDAIWFDDETVWRTPNYYVQQLFAKYIGKKTLATTFETYVNGSKEVLAPRGGIEIATKNATVVVKEISVVSNLTGTVLFEQDFTTALKPEWNVIPGSADYELDMEVGLILRPSESGLTGLYIMNKDWSNYTVKVKATKQSGIDGFYVGVGVTEISADKKDAIEYAIGYGSNATGVKVFKEGIEAYTLGDYSSSSAAGNLRSSCYEELTLGTEYTISVNYAGDDCKLVCSYTDGTFTSKVHDYKLEAYNKDVYSSVTADEKNLFAKLVNADNFDKVINITVKNGAVSSTAKLITLTAPKKLVHVPNVNGKHDEKVVPTEQTITVDGNAVTLTLPAYSCNVLVLEK